MLSILLVPVLLGVSMLVQRPIARLLKVKGLVRPLMPLSAPPAHQLAVRGSGLLFTFALVLAALTLQTHREQRLVPRVEVAAGLPAAKAGVITGDLVVEVDGAPVDDFAQLRDAVQSGREQTRLRVQREGQTRETSMAEAIERSLSRVIMVPRLMSKMTARPGSTAPPTDDIPSAEKRALLWSMLNFALVLAWWFSFGIEFAALAVGAALFAKPEHSEP